MSESQDERFAPDADRVATLRAIADDVRGETTESEHVAAILYRISDLYDPNEETTPEAIHRNVRTILNVRSRGGLPNRED